jgi:LacI family transcriptional regulator, galactose operon repressor
MSRIMAIRRAFRPTLTDIARMANVSPATVSRALARPELVNTDTQQRIHAVAQRLGYLPDGAGRALASGRSHTVGVIVPTLDAAIFSRAIQGLQRALVEAGYQLLVAAHDYSLAAEASAVRAILAHRVDGLILVGSDRAEETRGLLRAAKLPVVIIWSFDEEFDCIGFDNELAGRLAAQHLLALGHRRIGMISGLTAQNDRARLRLRGVRAAMRDVGCELPDWYIVERPFTLDGGRVGLSQLLALEEPPSAIVCGNDLLAAGVVFEATARGISVPGRLSVIGIDNLDISAHLNPPLTTVHLPTGQLGAAAAQQILARIGGKAAPARQELQIALVTRGSTARR